MSEKEKTVFEGEREIPVYTECDLLVVGGGAAGHSAAVAAARAGCKNIVLMERYGYMGGDVTGGYVIMVPRLSFYNKQYVRGLQEEWFTRMESIPGAVLGPSGDEIGCEDPVLVNAWKNIHDCFSTNAKLPERLVRSVYFEPNQLKIEMDKMLLEHKDSIHVMCHSWGTRPIMDGDTIKGVYFESKEGRKAVLAKIVIDATGDGDIFRQTGCPYFGLADKLTRCATTALVSAVAIGIFSANGKKPIMLPRLLCMRDFPKSAGSVRRRCPVRPMMCAGSTTGTLNVTVQT